MKSLPKVVGIVEARNEWPLLSLSISHALMYHLDEVYVLNHMSTDGTIDGIEKLKGLWRGRIHLFNYYDDHDWQEAATSIFMEMVQPARPDWIYIFDADEFMLTQSQQSLKEILGGVDQEYAAVLYNVQNWVSIDNFQEIRLNHYKRLLYRSVPNLPITTDPETIIDEIKNGKLNYFDVPFQSKVVFRNHPECWVAAGTHFLKNPADVPTLELESDLLTVAHFPLLSKKRLQKRGLRAQQKIKDGYPPGHGWQSHLVYWFLQNGLSEQFWQAHSISDHNNSSEKVSFVVDDSFVKSIKPVIYLLQESFDSDVLDPGSSDIQDDTLIPFRSAVSAARRFQLIADGMRQQRDMICQEFAAFRKRKKSSTHILYTIVSVLLFTLGCIIGLYSMG